MSAWEQQEEPEMKTCRHAKKRAKTVEKTLKQGLHDCKKKPKDSERNMQPETRRKLLTSFNI